jgi:hypothetical protein
VKVGGSIPSRPTINSFIFVMTKKKKKLTDDELKEIFEKVYVDRTDYKNLDKSVDYEHLSDDYDLIGGIIYRKKKKD